MATTATDEGLTPRGGTGSPRAAGDAFGDTRLDMPPAIENLPLRDGPGQVRERAARRRRLLGRAAAGLGAACAAYAAFTLFAADDGRAPMRVADLAADPQRLGAISGRTSAEYKEKVDTYARLRAEDSLKDGTSFVAPVSEVERPRAVEPVIAPRLAPRGKEEPNKKPATSFATGERAARREEKAARRQPPPAPERSVRQERMERAEIRRSRGDSELMGYLGSLRPQESQPMTYVFNRPSATQPPSSAATASSASTGGAGSGIPGVLPGDILYCLNRVALNSDAPGPAMVEVVAGPLRGAKVIGSFQRLNKHLVLRFSQLVARSGVSYRISGYGIDPRTDATAVRSGVDSHYLERWGGIVAASFLQGYGEAVQRSGLTTTSTAYGTTQSYPDYDVEAQLWLGAARVGERAASLFQSQFGMAPTVTLRGGTEIGVLLLDVGQGRRVGNAASAAATARGRAGQAAAQAGQAAAAAGDAAAYADEITAEQQAARARERALAAPVTAGGSTLTGTDTATRAAGAAGGWQEGR